MTIYVGNMSYDTDERTLRDTFPGVVNVKIPTDRESGKPRGYVCTMWCVLLNSTDTHCMVHYKPIPIPRDADLLVCYTFIIHKYSL